MASTVTCTCNKFYHCHLHLRLLGGTCPEIYLASSERSVSVQCLWVRVCEQGGSHSRRPPSVYDRMDVPVTVSQPPPDHRVPEQVSCVSRLFHA
jgi:hypothetical protein